MDFKTAYLNAIHYGVRCKRVGSDEWMNPIDQSKIDISDVLTDDWILEDLDFEPIYAWAVIKKDGTKVIFDDFNAAKELMQSPDAAIIIKLIDERELEPETVPNLFSNLIT